MLKIVERIRGSPPLSHAELLEILKYELTEKEYDQLQISYKAFCCDEQLIAEIKSREANAINGDITESESDDADEICRTMTPLDDSMWKLVQKRRVYFKRQTSRLKAKRIAEQNFLLRKVSQKVKGIEKDFPEIGSTIEEFVKDNNVGADQWQRTGVLTFAKRATYERIR